MGSDIYIWMTVMVPNDDKLQNLWLFVQHTSEKFIHHYVLAKPISNETYNCGKIVRVQQGTCTDYNLFEQKAVNKIR